METYCERLDIKAGTNPSIGFASPDVLSLSYSLDKHTEP